MTERQIPADKQAAIIQRRLAVARERALKEQEIRNRTWGINAGKDKKGDTYVINPIRNALRRRADRKAEQAILNAPSVPGAAEPAAVRGEPTPAEVDDARERLRQGLQQDGGAINTPTNAPQTPIHIPEGASPTERLILERLAGLENRMNSAPGGPGTSGRPWWEQYSPPPWMGHGQGGGHGYSMPPGSPMNAPAPGAPAQSLDRAGVDQMIREAIDRRMAELKEGQPAAASPEQHQSAANTLRATGKAKWDEHAKFVAEKKGLDANGVRKWMGAPRRWIRSFAEGFFGRGVFGGLAAAYGTGLASTIPVIGSAVTSITAFGVTIPISLPLILAAATGALAWSGVRWTLGMYDTDKSVNAGWEAKKISKKMGKWERGREKASRKWGLAPGSAEETARKREELYAKFSKRPAVLRMHALPGLIGTLGMGGLMYAAHTGNLNAENFGKLKDFGKSGLETGRGWLGGLWERVSTWLTGGTPITPGSTAAHHSAALYGGAGEFDGWEGGTRLGRAIEDLADTETERAALEDAYSRRGVKIDELQSELKMFEDQWKKDGNEIYDLKNRTPAEATPPTPAPIEPSPAPAPSLEPTPRPGVAPLDGGTVAPLTLPDLVKLEDIMHLRVDDRGIWAIEDIIKQKLQAQGITDPKMVTWFTDAMEDYTQPTSKHFTPGLLDQITGVRGVTQTTIPTLRPDGTATIMRTEYLFGNTEIYDKVLQRISQAPFAEIPNPTLKTKLSGVLFDLFSDARTLITHSR